MEKKRETITGFPNLEFSCAVCRVPCACVISVFSFLNFHRRVFLFHYRIPTDCTRCWYFKTNNRSYTIVHTTIRMIRYKDGEIKSVTHNLYVDSIIYVTFSMPIYQIIEITFWTIVFSLSFLLWEKPWLLRWDRFVHKGGLIDLIWAMWREIRRQMATANAIIEAMEKLERGLCGTNHLFILDLFITRVLLNCKSSRFQLFSNLQRMQSLFNSA